jgi:hypothetical protein
LANNVSSGRTASVRHLGPRRSHTNAPARTDSAIGPGAALLLPPADWPLAPCRLAHARRTKIKEANAPRSVAASSPLVPCIGHYGWDTSENKQIPRISHGQVVIFLD